MDADHGSQQSVPLGDCFITAAAVILKHWKHTEELGADGLC